MTRKTEHITSRTVRPYEVILWIAGQRYGLVPLKEKTLTLEELVTLLLGHCVHPLEKIRGASRKPDLVKERHLFCYMLKKHTGLTLKDIGIYMALGKVPKNHATIINSCRRIDDWYDTDELIRQWIEEVEKDIRKKIADL